VSGDIKAGKLKNVRLRAIYNVLDMKEGKLSLTAKFDSTSGKDSCLI
jgi:hypothetical protein